MESKFKGQTGNTPPSSYDGKTGERVPQSERSANKESLPTNTNSTDQSLKPTSGGDKIRTAAEFMKASLNILEANKKARRFKVRNKAGVVTGVVVVFDMKDWTEELELKE